MNTYFLFCCVIQLSFQRLKERLGSISLPMQEEQPDTGSSPPPPPAARSRGPSLAPEAPQSSPAPSPQSPLPQSPSMQEQHQQQQQPQQQRSRAPSFFVATDDEQPYTRTPKISFVDQRRSSMKKQAKIQTALEWQLIATIMDRICLMFFVTVMFITSVSILTRRES